VDGACEVMCNIGHKCQTDMDCPSEPPDNVCTTGPWECVDESCQVRNKDCSVPM
jgi:hypothetical protein